MKRSASRLLLTSLALACVLSSPGSSDIVVLKSHMMFWEQADEFNAALDRFLRAIK